MSLSDYTGNGASKNMSVEAYLNPASPRLDPSPLVDNTKTIQAFIDKTPDGTLEKPSVIRLPFTPEGFRVDGTINIDNRKHLHIKGPYSQYTVGYGWQLDGHPCEHMVCTNAQWLIGGTRWVKGQSIRAHWVIDRHAGAGEYSENILLDSVHVKGYNKRRVERVISGNNNTLNYAYANYGAADITRSLEAEHGFSVLGNAKNISFLHCSATDTGGDGWIVDVHAANGRNDISIVGCKSYFAGRHGVGVGDVDGLVISEFLCKGAASAMLDVEANAPTSRGKNITLRNSSCDVYRIPILIQNYGQEDITIDGITILEHGFGSTVWYPIVQAGYVGPGVPLPVGTITVKNVQLAPGIVWDQNTGDTITITNWPNIVVENNV